MMRSARGFIRSHLAKHTNTRRQIMPRDTHAILTVDAREAVFFGCHRAEDSHWRITPRSRLANESMVVVERHRPNALGRGPSPSAAQRFASTGHEVEEAHRRFAIAVADWLRAQRQESPASDIIVFASSSLFPWLREEWRNGTTDVELHESELAWMEPNQLVRHTSVVRRLEATEAARVARRP
jgi:Protein required for attachment to host cells